VNLSHPFDQDAPSLRTHAPRFRVLCVEDDGAYRNILAQGLEKVGFDAVMASDGRDALVQFQKNVGGFEAILTDSDMPEMDGLEMVREVRRLGYKGRIVVMSGNLSLKRMEAFGECNVSGFFRKPFDLAMLATLLSEGRSSS
jgi:DNA-binding NtrC family response regulator